MLRFEAARVTVYVTAQPPRISILRPRRALSATCPTRMPSL